VHKKSSMRSVHVKLPLHGLEPQLSISEEEKKLLSLNPKLFILDQKRFLKTEASEC